eukprot:scaffold4449_cov93-Isochrysis_galbana.AAC.4
MYPSNLSASLRPASVSACQSHGGAAPPSPPAPSPPPLPSSRPSHGGGVAGGVAGDADDATAAASAASGGPSLPGARSRPGGTDAAAFGAIVGVPFAQRPPLFCFCSPGPAMARGCETGTGGGS